VVGLNSTALFLMTAPVSFNPDWLERVNRLAIIATLVPGTVHDVNNALQVISGSAELLGLGGSASPENITRRGMAIADQARRATGSLGELAQLVRDSSDVSQRVHLREMADRSLTLRQHALRKAKIDAAVDGSDAVVRANPRHLLQIVLNLMLNAEAALAGQEVGVIRVTVSRTDGVATLVVADNACGVEEARRPELFTVPTIETARLPQHLGIGLFVSNMLAARNEGSLTYAPSPTGGSAFTLTLKAE
jgi:C4-dicarboxylate-specific signal transduction histidine kinase